MTQFGVFEWNQAGSYPGHQALKMYWKEGAAERYANKLNAQGRNLVVREVRL